MNKNKIIIGILLIAIGLMGVICIGTLVLQKENINQTIGGMFSYILCCIVIYAGARVIFNEINNIRKR